MLTKFHEHRATSHLYTKGTSIRYPITFDTMINRQGNLVKRKFTHVMEFHTLIIRGILKARHGDNFKKTVTLRQIHEATLDHINAQIQLQ